MSATLPFKRPASGRRTLRNRRYGTLKSWAAQLGYTDAVALFDANLQEELATDQKLTELGELSANSKGAKKPAA
jgi:ferritin-like metal-binding protein YciE